MINLNPLDISFYNSFSIDGKIVFQYPGEDAGTFLAKAVKNDPKVIGDFLRNSGPKTYVFKQPFTGSARASVKMDDITAIKVLTIDIDARNGQTEIEPNVPFSYIVETSEGSFNCHWVFSNPVTDIARVDRLNKAIHKFYGGRVDQCMQSLRQIVRAPGCLRNTGFISHVVEVGRTVTIEQLEEAYADALVDCDAEVARNNASSELVGYELSPEEMERLKTAVEAKIQRMAKPLLEKKEQEGGVNNALYATSLWFHRACTALGYDMSEVIADAVILAAATTRAEKDDVRQIGNGIKDAERKKGKLQTPELKFIQEVRDLRIEPISGPVGSVDLATLDTARLSVLDKVILGVNKTHAYDRSLGRHVILASGVYCDIKSVKDSLQLPMIEISNPDKTSDKATVYVDPIVFWNRSPLRLTIDGIGWRPDKPPLAVYDEVVDFISKSYYNVFTGFGHTAKPDQEGVTKFIELLNVIVKNDEHKQRNIDYILQSFKNQILTPHNRIPALLLYGEKGTGKNSLVLLIDAILGGRSVTGSVSQNNKTEAYDRALLMVFDEACGYSNNANEMPAGMIEQYKSLITNVNTNVDIKYGRKGSFKAYYLTILTTNEIWKFPIDKLYDVVFPIEIVKHPTIENFTLADEIRKTPGYLTAIFEYIKNQPGGLLPTRLPRQLNASMVKEVMEENDPVGMFHESIAVDKDRETTSAMFTEQAADFCARFKIKNVSHFIGECYRSKYFKRYRVGAYRSRMVTIFGNESIVD